MRTMKSILPSFADLRQANFVAGNCRSISIIGVFANSSLVLRRHDDFGTPDQSPIAIGVSMSRRRKSGSHYRRERTSL